MERVCKFLKDAGVYYLATVEGDQPRVRPFGTAHIFEGKLYIQTGHVKPCAQQLIEDGDTIFVDAGTTTMYLIDHLDPRKRVTIVTANLSLIEKAYDHENVELIVIG